MKNLSVLLLTAAVTIAGAWTIVKGVSANSNADRLAIIRSTDAAYRDGLYLGRLDAQAGRRPHPAIGRWSQDADRSLFRAGYNAGYTQASALVQNR